ncbi:MAG: PAS domain S-box protein [Bacillota bacterium]
MFVDLFLGKSGVDPKVALFNRVSGSFVLAVMTWLLNRKDKIANSLNESEEQFSTAMENVPFPVMIHAEGGQILYINNSWREISGYGHEEIPTIKIWAEKAYGDQNIFNEDRINDLYKIDKKTYNGEFIVKTKSGKERVWDFSTSPLKWTKKGRQIFISVADDITERKKAERLLQKSVDRFRVTFDQTAVGIAHIKNDGSWLWFNRKLPSLLGYSASELKGMMLNDITYSEDKQTGSDELEAMLNNELESVNLDKRLIKKDGTIFWAAITASLGGQKPGEQFMIVVIKDITKRKILEQALKESEERFRLTFENAGTGIVHIRPDGKWIRVNNKYCEIVGHTREELESLTFSDITHPDDIEKDLENRRRLLKGEIENFRMEKRYIRRDGSIAWVILTCTIVIEPTSEQKYFVSTLEDITERKQQEEELLKQKSRVDELNEFNSKIMEYSPYGIAAYEASGKCTYVNDMFAEIIGGKRYQILKQNFHSIDSWKRSGQYDMALESITDGKFKNKEIQFVSSFGKEVWVDCSVIPFQLRNKLRLLVVFADVSGYRKAEAKLLEQAVFAERISSITKVLSEAKLDLNTVLNNAVRQLHEYTGDDYLIRLVSADRKQVTHSAFYHKDMAVMDAIIEVEAKVKSDPSESLTGEVLKTGDPLLINNVTENPRKSLVRPEFTEIIEKLKTRSLLAVPLRAYNESLGTITVSRSTDDEFTTDDISFVKEVAERIGVFAENAQLYSEKLYEIEERKNTEEELRLTEERFRRAITNAPIPIMIRAEDGKVISINDTWTELTGYNCEDIPTIEEWTRKAYGGQMNKIREYIDTVHERDEKINLGDFIISTKDGRKITWEFFTAPLGRFSDGRKLAISMGIDVTERRQMEEALRKSEEQFRAMAESMPQIVWTANSDGNVDYYNQRWNEYSGMPVKEGHGWGWAPVLHPEDEQATFDAWIKAVGTGSTYEISHRIKRWDGEYRWHLSRGVPMRDSNGQLIKWFGTATDIHDQKTIQQDLEKILNELERSNNELEQFAYSASHDLQEPIRMIKSYAQLLERKYNGSFDEKAKSYFNYISDGALRMQQLVHDLLQYSRITTQAKPFQKIDLKDLLLEVEQDLRLSISESKAHIEYDDLPCVCGDSTQLRQLFQNLIQNAIKFRREVPPSILVKGKRDGNEALISVSDNGIGIEPEYHQRVFQIFQRLHERNKYPGTGIGLALVKKIVERHGGKIWIESAIGKGTVFNFTLPADKNS